MFEHLFKLNLLGETGAGKSALLQRFADDVFTESYLSIRDIDFKLIDRTVQGQECRLQIWDTPRKKSCWSVDINWSRAKDGFILCYDVTEQSSFDNLNFWLEEIHQHHDKDIPIFLVGTKADQICERTVTHHQATEFAKCNNLWGFREVSAKNSTNVEELFAFIIQFLLERKKLQSEFEVAKPFILQQIIQELDQAIQRVERFRFFFTSGMNKAWALRELKSHIETNWRVSTNLGAFIDAWKERPITIPGTNTIETFGQILHQHRLVGSSNNKEKKTATEEMLNRISKMG